MHAAEVEVALGRHVRYVRSYFPLLTKLPYLRRSLRVIDGR